MKKVYIKFIENTCENCLFMEEDKWYDKGSIFFCNHPDYPLSTICKKEFSEMDKLDKNGKLFYPEIPDWCPLPTDKKCSSCYPNLS